MKRPGIDIDAVIFDFAGVLSTSPAEAMLAQADGLDIDLAVLMPIVLGPLHEDGDHPWHLLERGRITMDEYEAAIEPTWRDAGFETFPAPPRGDQLLSVLKPVIEMIDTARDVRAAGYRTAILTNNTKEWVVAHRMGSRRPGRRRRRLVRSRPAQTQPGDLRADGRTARRSAHRAMPLPRRLRVERRRRRRARVPDDAGDRSGRGGRRRARTVGSGGRRAARGRRPSVTMTM